MPGPDRSVSFTIRFSFTKVIDEASLVRLTGVERPTATQMRDAFAKWKMQQVEEATRNFKTGNSLAADSAIEVTTS